MPKKKFVIIDAMALAYKGYFAFISRPLTTKSGEATSAVFGFVSQLIKIIEDTRPDYISVAFDSKEKTFRHDRYEFYKSSRAKMPDDMIPQLQRIKDIVEAFNIPIYILPGYEADDIMGTVLKRAEKLGFDCFALTPDKDLMQIISDNINVIKPGKSTDEMDIIDKQRVLNDLGFEPIHMIDYLSLVGDSSDDIPGVSGIGPKTASPLIQEFGTIENIYENLKKIEKVTTRKKLENGKESAFLSKELATIEMDIPFKFDIEAAKFEAPKLKELLQIFTDLEFRSFANKLSSLYSNSNIEIEEKQEIITEEKTNFDTVETKYSLISDFDAARKLAYKLAKCELFVFDTETDSLDVLDLNLAGVSFCIMPGEAYFVAVNPYRKAETLFSSDLSDRLDVEDFVELFKDLFENEKIKKVCQNGKYDIGVLRSYGIEVKNFYFDTMLASYCIDPDEKHGMDDLAQKYLNYTPIPLIDLIGSKKTPEKIFEADKEKLSNYSCEDADVTFKLYDILKKELEKEGLEKLAFEVEFPLAPVLEDMERLGIKIDKDILKELSNDLQIKLESYTSTIYKLAGKEFNINSPKQMQEILFDKLQLQPTQKTKTGFSTDARSLENLKGQHEIVDVILDYRQVSKLKSTYADSLPNLINKKTGRVHTTFSQAAVSTGRLSSLNPNLQNIPIRTDLGKEIRKAFVPRNKDYLILSCDYSQIELRIMASICEDENLMNAFINGEDIHRSTAGKVFRVPPEEVTPDMRRKAKEVNFGILYGLGPFGLKTRLGITQTHAKEIIDTYFSTFKSVKRFMEDSVERAKEKGFAETLLGRRRFLPNINSNNRVVRQFEERVAVNMPIQGTAADMIKIAMIRIHDELKSRNAKTQMVLQVHDELVFDAHKDEIDEMVPLIKQIMENALPLKVPVVAETGTGDNWLDAH
ncbi:MAG: DNA polymerase I [bacterium]